MVKMDPLNVVSHNVAVDRNLSTTLNEDLLYLRHTRNISFKIFQERLVVYTTSVSVIY
jgi:hypothetical protein